MLVGSSLTGMQAREKDKINSFKKEVIFMIAYVDCLTMD